MNKEEMLIKLTELQEMLDKDVDSYEIDKRVEEIEKISAEINAQISSNNATMKYYAELLNDDKNFLDETPLQYYLMLEAQKLEILNAKEIVEKENAYKISGEESIVASSEEIITISKEEIKQLEKNNAQLNIDIRRARLSSNDGKIKDCENSINLNNEKIQTINDQITNVQKDIDDHKVVIASLNDTADNMKKDVEKAKTEYNDVIAKKTAAKKGEINLVEKNKIESNLEILKSVTKAITDTLEQRSLAISYDFAGQVKKIINDYSTASITEEEMKSSLLELKGKLPESFLETDENARNTELAENQKVQELLEANIEDLSKKIADDNNYMVSEVEKAKIKEKLSTCKKNMSGYDLQIAMLNSQILSEEAYLSDLNEYNEIINVCNEENEKIAGQLIFNNGVDKELEAELMAKQKSNFSIIAEANELIENMGIDKSENAQILVILEERKARTEKLIASYQTKLADENAIDKSKKRFDQIELDTMQQGYMTLKNRNEFLNNSIVVIIDNIINQDVVESNIEDSIENNVENTIENKEVEIEDLNSNVGILPFPPSDGFDPEDMPIEDVDFTPIENSISPISVGEVLPNNLFNPEEELDVLGVDTEEDIDLVVGNTFIPDKKNGKIEEVAISGVNENLRKKSKEKRFTSALKKRLIKIGILVGLIVTLGFTMKSCSNHLQESATEAALNNDDEMDGIIDSDDPKNALQAFLDKLGITNGTDENDENKSEDDSISNNKLDNSKESILKKLKDAEKIVKVPAGGAPGHSDAPYTETITGPVEKVAPPVDPKTIVDTNANVKAVHVNPVDPKTIVDTNPGNGGDLPTPSVDEGEKKVVVGVSGNEVVPEDAWDDEELKQDDQIDEPTDEQTEEQTDEQTQEQTDEQTQEQTDEKTDEQTDEQTDDQAKTTTKIVVNPGDTLVMEKDGETYKIDNGIEREVTETDKDVFEDPDVESVSIETDEEGKDTIVVAVQDAEREVPLTDEEVAAISEENGIDAAEIARLEAEAIAAKAAADAEAKAAADKAALEELKQQLQDTQTEEQTVSNTK